MNHVTVGVYHNQTFKKNVVRPEDLEHHIAYNLRMRPGRAFFVDGKCLNPGYLSKENCAEWETKIQQMNINSSVPSKQYQ